MTISANGTSTVSIKPGQYYTIGVAGTWDSGSMAIGWTDEAGNSVAFPDSPLSADGGFVFAAPAGTLYLTLSGATSPSLTVSLATIQ